MSVDLLLDTHVLIWLALDDPRWEPLLRDAHRDAASTVTVSAVSWSEIAIKHALGKLPVSVRELRPAAERLGLLELPLLGSHAEQLELLPMHHRDPFDRMLAAQSIAEEMQLVTADPAFNAYEGLRLYRP